MAVLIGLCIIFREPVCHWLNDYVTLCFLDGFACYLFGVGIIDQHFILQISQHISSLDDRYREFEANRYQHRKKSSKTHIFSQHITGETLLKQEILGISVLFLSAWLSTLFIWINDPLNSDPFNLSNAQEIRSTINLATGFTDFLRYAPSAILVAFIRVYFRTFNAELTAFRQRYGIITRFEKLDDIEIQQSLLRNPWSVGSLNDIKTGSGQINPLNENDNPLIVNTPCRARDRTDLADQKQKDSEYVTVDLTGCSPYIVRLDISHYEFKRQLETILFPFRNMCRKLRLFFLCNLVLNGLCFVCVVISTIQSIVGTKCDINSKRPYYLHYVTEMTVYFIAWVLLMIPLAENHRALRSLNRDVKAKIVMNSPTEQLLIHHYLDSMMDASPFAVGYIAPTYSQLIAVFYVLVVVVCGQLMSYFVYSDH